MWKFHRVCGKNVSLENDCTTAKRLNPTDTSDHGICFTNTPLVNGELFEIQVEELVTRWGGSFSTVVYGVVDVHAKCCQVSIVNQDTTTEAGAQLAIKKTQNFSLQPTDWNVQTVCDFIDSIPECAPYVEKFRSERINGAALLELDKKDLKDFFEMPLGLAVNVCSHLKKYEEKNK
ncbi:uncharacterized protein LOC143053460 isoform X5 [Mytilus galloprovincialis]|uniref:uncharacterized protein LOC143053460 isoform X5 n=1 Tax=Mytilus galloprovincialis TaxID=29158 RepID=UPI003F7C52D2